MGRRRDREGLVHAPEVAPVVPSDPRRPGPRHSARQSLRRSRLLTPHDLKAALVDDARAAGFDVVRIAAPDSIPEAAGRLERFIADDHHGTMTWLADTAARRGAPRAMWPGCRAVVMLGLNYGPETDPLANLGNGSRATISVYARNRDYHDLIKGRLKGIAQRHAVRAGSEVKVFVDTAPLMEKPLAEAAGIGWQGKHTNLVSRDFGSWLFLGAILSAAPLPADAAETDHCGQCRACLDICPTRAFPAPYRLDARRCISYLTIEHHGPIPAEFRAAMGNRIYGCDDCLAVCPWNKFAHASHEAKLQARPELEAPRLADLATLDDAGFRKLFTASPVKRIGRDRFVRNVMIAVGNSGEPSLAATAEARLADTSPLVRGAAVWALSRLLTPPAFAALQAAHLPAETDATVGAEWRGAAA